MSKQQGGQRYSTPLITVAMPIYNAGEYLRLAVLSIINQTFTDWEMLIIDDGSTDNSLEKIADLDDLRIKTIRHEINRGLAARLNEAIDLASGKYLARMDQDDISYPNRFFLQIAALQEDCSLDLVAVKAITIDVNNKITGYLPSSYLHSEICTRPWCGFYFPHPTWLGKTSWFRKHRYAMPGPYCCEDQELLLRSYQHSNFTTLNKTLFAYRVGANIESKKLAKTRRAVLQVQCRNFINQKNWYFVFMALVAFMGRKVDDLLLRSPGSYFQPQCSHLDNSVISQWSTVLSNLLVYSSK